MEEYQIKIIRELQTRLLKLTNCTVSFLAYFTSNGILSSDDLEEIETRGRLEGASAKTSKFYELLQTKTGSFSQLLEALHEAGQTGASALLQEKLRENVMVSSKREKILKFSKPPKYLEKFLADASQYCVLVLSSDTKFTCDRIIEPMEGFFACKAFEYTPFLNYISGPQSSENQQGIVYVVNCADKNYLTILRSGACKQTKVILVASQLFKNFQETLLLVYEQLLWAKLTPVFQNQIYERVQGMTKIPGDVCFDILTGLDSDILYALVQEENVKLLKDNIPQTIKYYIPRFLVSRDVISNIIFKKNTTDIVLIEGIQRHQLTELASAGNVPMVTETSGNLVHAYPAEKLRSNFVVLEHPSHYNAIVSRYKDKNTVHHLVFEDEKLRWKRSHGDVKLLQSCIHDKQEEIKEDIFIQSIETHKIKNICISDTPGMDKSVLLGHIGAQLNQTESKENVIFIVINELVQQIKINRPGESFLTEDHIVEALATLVCENELGKQAMRFKSNFIQHLLLDAFDEIGNEEMHLGYECIRLLQISFPKTIIWITTRPHMLVAMEEKLGILGYNIKEFDESNQLSFLSEYWLVKYSSANLDAEKLNKFAEVCIQSLRANLNQQEEDFAGVPLQCLLIAEVYGGNAIEYSEAQGTHIISLDEFRIDSILDLYNKLVSQKLAIFFDRYPRPHTLAEIEIAHVYHALLLLFPKYLRCLVHHKLATNFESQNLLQVVFDTGIMEPKPTKYKPKPRFIHRTFAEFFVAKFLVSKLEGDEANHISDLLYSAILDTVPCSFKTSACKVTAKNFKNSVICYFLDAMIRKTDRLIFKIPNSPIRCVNKISVACAYSNSSSIFQKLVFPVLESKDAIAKKVFQENYVIVAVARAGTNILSIACTMFRKFNPSSEINKIMCKDQTLLELAVNTGSYCNMEYLLSAHSFNVLLNDNKFHTNLVYTCVNRSVKDSYKVIRDKRQILAYLVNKFSGPAPLLDMSELKNVHCLLLCEIFSLTYKMFREHDNLDRLHNFLIANTQFYTCYQLMYITTYLSEQIGLSVDYVCNKWGRGTTMLFNIFYYIQIGRRFLDFLDAHKVKIKNFSDRQKKSLLKNVVKKKNKRLIKYLIQNSDYTELFQTLVTWCCRYGHWLGAAIILKRMQTSNAISENLFENLYRSQGTFKYNGEAETFLLLCIKNDTKIAEQCFEFIM